MGVAAKKLGGQTKKFRLQRRPEMLFCFFIIVIVLFYVCLCVKFLCVKFFLRSLARFVISTITCLVNH